MKLMKRLVIFWVLAVLIWVVFIGYSIVRIPNTSRKMLTIGRYPAVGKELQGLPIDLELTVHRPESEFGEIYLDSNSYTVVQINGDHEVKIITWRLRNNEAEYAVLPASIASHGPFDAIDEISLKNGDIFVLSKVSWNIIINHTIKFVVIMFIATLAIIVCCIGGNYQENRHE